jgi:uncharacterized protein YndB with AHSA1/START domain
MVDVTTSTIIAVPLERVAAYAANPDHAPEWYVNIKEVEWKTPPPLSLHSLVAFKARFLGRQLAYTYEIVEWEPQKKLVMRTADGPFPMETTYLWEAIDHHATRMILRNRGNPSGFSKIFAPFMSLAMRRANQKDLDKLKRLLEA